jgi:hypothetical protein
MRPQLAANARKPGTMGALAQPGIAANGTGRTFAAAGRAGAGQAAHSGQAGQTRASGDCGDGGRSAQLARARIAHTKGAKARTMWVIYLEMGMALALLILIVWWTWPAKRPRGTPKDDGTP